MPTQITTLSSSLATGITLTTTGAYLSPFTITQTGTITSGTAGVSSTLSGAYLLNQGLINATGSGVSFTSGGTVVNSGSILGAASNADGVLMLTGGSVLNEGGGVISGGSSGVAAYQAATFSVVNDGVITGKASDGVIIVNNGAVQNLGTAALISGANTGVEIVGTGAVTNSGTIMGTAGAGVFMLSGGAANSGLITGSTYGVQVGGGVGTVTNTGTITASSGIGLFMLGGTVNNSALISGSRYGVEAPAEAATVTNTGTITASGEAGVKLLEGEVINQSATALISGGTYGVSFEGPSGSAVSNDGTITGNADGIRFEDGGAVINGSTTALIQGGTFGVTIAGGAGTVANAGTILATGTHGAAIYLAAGGSVNNYATTALIEGAIGAGALASATIVNAGTIEGIGTAHTDRGVYLKAGGSVNNTGFISGAYGVWAGAAATIANTGTIIGNQANGINLTQGGSLTNAGSISGYNGVLVQYESAIVSNSGTITGWGSLGCGVALFAGGSLLNTGTIGGTYAGVVAETAQVTNQGLISGVYGVYLSGSTLFNSGTIAGTKDALYLGGTSGNRVVLETGGVLSGGVLLGTLASSTDNTLEFAAKTGSLGGIGGPVMGFETFAFDAGVAWTLSGTASGFASGTLTGFGRQDVLDITGLATGQYGMQTLGASGLLTLAEPSGSLVLDFASVASGTVFTLASDSTGGVDIGIDRHILNTSLNNGIVLTATGAYLSAFTVTQSGTVSSFTTFTGAQTTLSAIGAVNSTLAGAMLVNEGLLTGTLGVYFADGGTISNAGTGAVIDGIAFGVFTGGAPGTVVNEGAITGGTDGVYLQDGGNVANYGSAALIDGALAGVRIITAAGTVVNTGSIIATYKGGVAIQLSSGTVVNSGTIAATGTKGTGIELSAGGAVTNIGTGASIYGKLAGVDDVSGLGLVVNGGTIIGAKGAGVELGAGGAVTNSGTIGGAVYGVAGLAGPAMVVNTGSIFATGTRGVGVLLFSGGILVNDGTLSGTKAAAELYGAAYNQLIVDPNAVFNGAVTANRFASNSIEFSPGPGTLSGIGTQFTNFQTLAFDSFASWNVSGTESGFNGDTITGFAAGDTLVIDGFHTTLESFSNGTLVLDNGTTAMTLDITGSLAVNDVGSNTDITDTTVICYLRGTMILTPAGEVPVETLRIGDAVVTRFGGYRPLKWIGRQSFGRRFVAGNRAQMPVRIAAGALGEGLPTRDLCISPGHSMLLGGTLVLARQLVNGVTITQDAPQEDVHYYQLEFETHDCVRAEGAWSESYADAPGYRGKFHNTAEFYALYPNYVEPEAVALCAGRPESGPALARALAPLVARAAALTAPGPLRGCVDEVTPDGFIRGWAWDAANPELPVLLEIVVAGRRLGTVLACDPRADLAAAGMGQGQCAFAFTSPLGLPADAVAQVQIRRVQDGAAVAFGAHSLAA
jgi:hypothetical protein